MHLFCIYVTRTRSYVFVRYRSAVLCLRCIPLRDTISLKGSLSLIRSLSLPKRANRSEKRAHNLNTALCHFFRKLPWLLLLFLLLIVFTFDISAYKNFPLSGRTDLCRRVCVCVLECTSQYTYVHVFKYMYVCMQMCVRVLVRLRRACFLSI